jgi:hypothetical protein
MKEMIGIDPVEITIRNRPATRVGLGSWGDNKTE